MSLLIIPCFEISLFQQIRSLCCFCCCFELTCHIYLMCQNVFGYIYIYVASVAYQLSALVLNRLGSLRLFLSSENPHSFIYPLAVT